MIDIEPLLHKLQQKLVSIYLPQFPVPFKLSVYADGLIVLTNLQEDIDVLTNNNEFSFISSAKMNWGKREGLMAGEGLGRGPKLPRVFGGRQEEYSNFCLFPCCLLRTVTGSDSRQQHSGEKSKTRFNSINTRNSSPSGLLGSTSSNLRHFE